MTYTEETGRHVTPERVRRGRELVEVDGFELVYECPLGWLGEVGESEAALQRLRVMHWEDDLPYTNDIPGQPGRFA